MAHSRPIVRLETNTAAWVDWTQAAVFGRTHLRDAASTDGNDQMLPIKPAMPFDVITPNAL
jgi:hypothetical protein